MKICIYNKEKQKELYLFNYAQSIIFSNYRNPIETLYFGDLKEIYSDISNDEENINYISNIRSEMTAGKTIGKLEDGKLKIYIIISSILEGDTLLSTIIHEMYHAIDYYNYYKVYGDNAIDDNSQEINPKHIYSNWMEYSATRKTFEELFKINDDISIYSTIHYNNMVNYIVQLTDVFRDYNKDTISYNNMTDEQFILIWKFKDVVLYFLAESASLKNINKIFQNRLISDKLRTLLINLSSCLEKLYESHDIYDEKTIKTLVTRLDEVENYLEKIQISVIE